MNGRTEATFAPSSPITVEGLKVLRSEALAAAQSGRRHIVIDLDEVGVLDSRLIATLISILRDVRQLGAEVSLKARRRGILDTLRVTALDRVFTIDVAPLESVAMTSPAPVKTVARHLKPSRRVLG